MIYTMSMGFEAFSDTVKNLEGFDFYVLINIFIYYCSNFLFNEIETLKLL